MRLNATKEDIMTLFILFGVQQEIRNYIKNNTMDTIKTQREERDK